MPGGVIQPKRDRKGRFLPGSRVPPCPSDFDVVFILIGRLACEEYYGAWRETITHWLEERGKVRLIAARAALAGPRNAEARRIISKAQLWLPANLRAAYPVDVDCEPP